MELYRFRDSAVPFLGLSTRHPSINEMRSTRLVNSSFRGPHLPDAAERRLCLRKLAVFSGKLPSMEAEIDYRLLSNSS
jgi:hypothetical protein